MTGKERVEWNGMEWNGMEWNGMEWNGMEWRMTGKETALCRDLSTHHLDV